MKRAVVVAAGLVCGCLVAPPAAAQAPEPLPLADLLADPAAYDERVVTVEGELVGDYGFRSTGSMWTQINDDSYARRAVVDGGELTGSNVGIGVRIPSDIGRELDPPGGYRLEGPLVRATGVWRYHDPDRGGESFLDATSLEVVRPGRRLEEGADWVVLVGGALLVSGALVLWALRRRSDAP